MSDVCSECKKKPPTEKCGDCGVALCDDCIYQRPFDQDEFMTICCFDCVNGGELGWQ